MVVVCAWAATATAGTPLDKPAFSASPAELLAAGKVPAVGDWPVSILREEHDVVFDGQGRENHRWRMVFVVRTQVGVDEWGTLGAHWSPFYQEKPGVRARVIQPDGTVDTLDPKLLSDAPIVETSPSVFSDQRTLHAPLPRMQIGSVVEEEVVTTDREPIIGTFGQAVVWPGNDVPVETFRATLSAPVGSKARIVARGLDPKVRPRHEVKLGRDTWVYDLGALAPIADRELSVPGDVFAEPRIGITTAPSWSAVSKEYRKVVERRIAEGAFALPAELPRTPTLATVNAITAWLHAKIRYTGIEFGEASNIPWPPAETVKRGFGDCKDKATLLVALLRQAGIPADLALLYDGPGRDIDPDLPGMGVFDHAIVRARVGTTDMWIDATEDMVAPGRLPVRDQERRALVISETTSALVTTPRFDDSKIRMVRTFEASEDGAAAVTEVTTVSGSFAPGYRTWLTSARGEELRKRLTTYASEAFVSEAFTSYAFMPVADLNQPVELTIKAAGAKRVYTDRDHLDVYLFPKDVLERVPGFLTEKPDPSEKPRVHAYAWATPHVFEIENRIVLPPGYEPPPVEPAKVRKLATATLSETRAIQGNTLIIMFRFETGKARLSPAELAALRAALQPISDETVHVVVAHRAWAASAKGKVRESIAECERLIALHPKEARHHSELATMYLNAGAGAAARREAAKAVQLEPKNPDPYVVQGWIHRHDSLGREYGFDFDHAGSIAALTKAKTYGPKHVGALVELARLLERDPQGRIVATSKEWAAAAAAWADVVKLDAADEHHLALARALLRADKPAEAEAAARRAASSEARDALVVAAAEARSPTAGINQASTMRSGANRTALLQLAGAELFMARAYPGMTALQREAGTFQSGTAEEAMFKSLVRHDEKFDVGRNPRLVVADLLLAATDTSHQPTSAWDPDALTALRRGLRKFAPQMAALRMLPSAALRDLVLSGLVTNLDGPPDGPWRIDAEYFGRKLIVYAARFGKDAKMLGMPDSPHGVGRYALQRIEAGDRASARKVMEWLHADLASSQPKAALLKVWTGTSPLGDKALAVAAAVSAAGTAGERSLAVLAKCEAAPDARMGCDLALALHYSRNRRWKELETHAKAWRARDPAAHIATQFQVEALRGLRRHDDADTLALALDADPNAHEVAARRASIAAERRDVPEAERRYEALVKSATASAADKNNYAWWMLGEKRDLKAALDFAQAAVREAGTPEQLNTLAAIEAERGDLGLARAHIVKAIDARVENAPANSDWYVIGRIYEQLGLRADAIAAYRRLDATDATFPSSTFYAMQRLKVLGAP